MLKEDVGWSDKMKSKLSSTQVEVVIVVEVELSFTKNILDSHYGIFKYYIQGRSH